MPQGHRKLQVSFCCVSRQNQTEVTEKGLSTVGPHGPHLRIPSFLISRHLPIPLGVPPCLRRVRQDHFGTAFTSIFSISRNALQLGGRLLKDFKVSNVTTDCLLLLDFFFSQNFLEDSANLGEIIGL